jgi:hypothetical protein
VTCCRPSSCCSWLVAFCWCWEPPPGLPNSAAAAKRVSAASRACHSGSGLSRCCCLEPSPPKPDPTKSARAASALPGAPEDAIAAANKDNWSLNIVAGAGLREAARVHTEILPLHAGACAACRDIMSLNVRTVNRSSSAKRNEEHRRGGTSLCHSVSDRAVVGLREDVVLAGRRFLFCFQV